MEQQQLHQQQLLGLQHQLELYGLSVASSIAAPTPNLPSQPQLTAANLDRLASPLSSGGDNGKRVPHDTAVGGGGGGSGTHNIHINGDDGGGRGSSSVQVTPNRNMMSSSARVASTPGNDTGTTSLYNTPVVQFHHTSHISTTQNRIYYHDIIASQFTRCKAIHLLHDILLACAHV